MANEDDVNRPGQEPSAQPPRPPFPPGGLEEEELIEEEVAPKPGRLERLAARFRKPADTSREAKATERTRALVILGVTSIACLFLFFGLFTTDSSSSSRERRTKPNLGRPEQSAVAPENANRSPVPQLSVNQQPNEEPSELSEKDLLATMRNRGTPAPNDATPTPSPKPKTLASVRFDDPALAEAYRRQGLTPPSPLTEIAAWDTSKLAPTPPAIAPMNPNEALRKSSIVFVRSSIGQTNAASATVPALEQRVAAMLPQGTALVARLQHAVSSAAKVPVIAVIEYNYERDGALVVPAGTKAYGELSQATPQGWVSLQFHTLELPGGEREKINGSAVSMERTALRGDVNGRNSGKKFLTRALTGVGTIAAYAVGGRGLGSNGLDSSILLRERLASNVALGGEQELARLAYQQNIVVTVPANTRFYLVLNADAAGQRPVGPPIQGTGQVLSAQELREMIQLRDELREMNRLATRNLQAGSTATPALPQEEK